MTTRVLMLTGVLGLGAGVLRADQSSLNIGVRAAVSAQLPKSDRANAPEPGRLYAILAVQQVESGVNLVKPVPERVLVDPLLRQLDAHGFRQIEAGQLPEILLTVQYGRGWLKNPYLGDSRTTVGVSSVTSNASSSTLEPLTNQEVVGSTSQLMAEKSPGYEAKLQKASYEKLYIRVMAWQFSTDPKSRARLLWQTTMVTDDPDHRDLNLIAGAMFAAGAPYFDRQIGQGEIEVAAPVPEGHVRIGTPEVVAAGASPKNESAATPPAPAIGAAEEPRRKFDVPAGAAVTTLQAFTRQSGEQIIYPIEQVQAARTNRVTGEFTTRAALERMLEGTGLVAVPDEATGAFVIHVVAPASSR